MVIAINKNWILKKTPLATIKLIILILACELISFCFDVWITINDKLKTLIQNNDCIQNDIIAIIKITEELRKIVHKDFFSSKYFDRCTIISDKQKNIIEQFIIV